MGGEKFKACNTSPVDVDKCNMEKKEFLTDLKDYKGKRLGLADSVLSNVDAKSFKLGETVAIEDCNYERDGVLIQKVYGAVDRTPFKKSFEFRDDQKLSQEIRRAAKLVKEKEKFYLFDGATQEWFEEIKDVVMLIADGRSNQGKVIPNSIEVVKLKLAIGDQKLDDKVLDELIYGERGALNFLLGISRVENVFCKMKKSDKGKVGLAIGGRGSFVQMLRDSAFDDGVAADGEVDEEGEKVEDSEEDGEAVAGNERIVGETETASNLSEYDQAMIKLIESHGFGVRVIRKNSDLLKLVLSKDGVDLVECICDLNANGGVRCINTEGLNDFNDELYNHELLTYNEFDGFLSSWGNVNVAQQEVQQEPKPKPKPKPEPELELDGDLGFGLTDEAAQRIQAASYSEVDRSLDVDVNTDRSEVLEQNFTAYKAAENRFVTEYNDILKKINAIEENDRIFEALWDEIKLVESSLFKPFRREHGLDAVKLNFINNTREDLNTRFSNVELTFLDINGFESNVLAMKEAVSVIDKATGRLKEFVNNRAGLFVSNDEVIRAFSEKSFDVKVGADDMLEVSKDGRVLVNIKRDSDAFSVINVIAGGGSRVQSLSDLGKSVSDLVNNILESKLDLSEDFDYVSDFHARSLKHVFVRFSDKAYGFVEFKENLSAEEKASLLNQPKAIKEFYKFSSRTGLGGSVVVEVGVFDGKGYMKETKNVRDLQGVELDMVRTLMNREVIPRVDLPVKK